MMAYSMDLRKRVMNEVKAKNMQLNEIAKLFKVDVKTIYRWRKKLETSDNFEAEIGYQKGHNHKIKDLESFQKFVNENPDLTLTEMAAKWGNVGRATIYRTLNKIDFTIKKNNSSIRKKMKKKEKHL